MRAKNNPFHGRREDLNEKKFIGSLVGKDEETWRTIGDFYTIGKSTVAQFISTVL
jgi:hypothetical protein